jgi:hypothetical protein
MQKNTERRCDMFELLKDGTIHLTRGDTARFGVGIMLEIAQENADPIKEPYVIQDDDTLTFTVKKDYDGEQLIVKKVIGNDDFHIEPTDTKGFAFGKYKYDVQLTTAKGDNYTFVADKIFKITKEVG